MTIGPIHHVAIVVRSIEEALPRYAELFGLTPEGEPFLFASQRVRLCFLPTGPEPAAHVELVEPTDDESGVARFLAARGEGLHHVCFQTDDVAKELEETKAKGIRVIDQSPRRGLAGMICFLHPAASTGVLVEYAQP